MEHKWNCHGSTRHAYDGSGSGLEDPGYFNDLSKWIPSTNSYPFSLAARQDIDSMEQGAVVVYYDSYDLAQHSATSLGKDITWGANNGQVGVNVYLDPSDNSVRAQLGESWSWANNSVYASADNWDITLRGISMINNQPSQCIRYIIIYRKR